MQWQAQWSGHKAPGDSRVREPVLANCNSLLRTLHSTIAIMGLKRERELTTDRLKASDVRVSWPMALAALEQVGPWTVYAFRLGVLELVHECAREMADRDAGPDVVERLRMLTEALAHIPWHTAPK
jgi:hypothetical protein